MRRASLLLTCVLFAGFALCVAACSKTVSYYIDVSAAAYALPAFPKNWKQLATHESAGIRVYAKTVWGDAPRTSGTVEEQYYALTAPWLSAEQSIAHSEENFEQACAAAKKFDDIAMPEKILAYDGLYPGDAGYKLRRRIVIYAEALSGNQAAAQNYIASIPACAQAQGITWIGAVGDVMPGTGTTNLLLQEDGIETVFGRLAPVMRSQHLLTANLETAITERGVEWPKTFRFRAKPQVLPALMASGIDVVNLANNHVYDYTEIGFDDTLAHLRAAGMPFVGAGENWEEAVRPFVCDADGTVVYVWGLAAFPTERTGFNGLKHASIQRGKPGLLWADDTALSAVIAGMREAKKQNALCIVSVHAGTEYVETPNAVQIALYRKLIDAGADIIFGHHPHVLQPMEWYVGKTHSGLILYSLGNFVFDNIEDNPKGLPTVLASVGVSAGTIKTVRLYPAKMNGFCVDSDDNSIRLRVLSMSELWARQ